MKVKIASTSTEIEQGNERENGKEEKLSNSFANTVEVQTKEPESSQEILYESKRSTLVAKPIVKCFCEVNLDDHDMIQCDKCLNWMHTVCTGFYSNTDDRIPTNYECHWCQFEDSKIHAFLSNLYIYRRIVSITFNEGIENQKLFADRVGIKVSKIRKFVSKMVNDGMLDAKFPPYNVIKNKETKIKIKKLFTIDLNTFEGFQILNNVQSCKEKSEEQVSQFSQLSLFDSMPKRRKISVCKEPIYLK